MLSQQSSPIPDPIRSRSEGEKHHSDAGNFTALARFLSYFPVPTPEDTSALTFNPGNAVLEHLKHALRHAPGTIIPSLDKIATAVDGAARIPPILADSIAAAEQRSGWSFLQACIDQDDFKNFVAALERGYPRSFRPTYITTEGNRKRRRLVEGMGTLLHYAALKGQGGHAVALIAAGEKVDILDSNRQTPLSLCGKVLLRRYVTNHSPTGKSALSTAYLHTAEVLIDAGASVSGGPRGNSFSYSYLMWLASGNTRFSAQSELDAKLIEKVRGGPKREIADVDSPFGLLMELCDQIGVEHKIPTASKLSMGEQIGLLRKLLAAGAPFKLISDTLSVCTEAPEYKKVKWNRRREFETKFAPHIREFVHAYSESVGRDLLQIFDHDMFQAKGNPFEAELFALANHPTGSRHGDFVGVFCKAVTAPYDFVSKGLEEGDLRHFKAWQLIGARTFQHLPLKLDARAIIPMGTRGEHRSLMTSYGFLPLHTKELGNGFALRTTKTEYIEALRGGYFVSKQGVGSMFIRNSSPAFDVRHLLASPAYTSRNDFWPEVLREYGRTAIGAAVLDRKSEFSHIMTVENYKEPDFMTRLEALQDTLTRALRRYHQWKCITRHDGLWKNEAAKELADDALYGAPGFRHVADFVSEWRSGEYGPLHLGWMAPNQPAFVTLPYVSPAGEQQFKLTVDSRIADGLLNLAYEPKHFPWSRYPDLRSFFQGGINTHGNLTLLDGNA